MMETGYVSPSCFGGKRVVTWEATWLIIPCGLGYVVNHHGDQKSPKDRGRRTLSKWPKCLNGF